MFWMNVDEREMLDYVKMKKTVSQHEKSEM